MCELVAGEVPGHLEQDTKPQKCTKHLSGAGYSFCNLPPVTACVQFFCVINRKTEKHSFPIMRLIEDGFL